MDNAHRKKLAVEFLQMAAAGTIAIGHERFFAPDCKHHNPYFHAGIGALTEAMVAAAKEHPETRLDVKHVLAEGDLVAVHSHVIHKPGDRGAAVVHLFRFAGDKIAEMWDIGQEVPADSPNKDGVF